LRFWIPIFVISAVLGYVETSIVATPGLWYLQLLTWFGDTSYDLSAISTTLSLAPFAIDPAIGFVAMFLIGRRFDLSFVFARTFTVLLFGTTVGTFGYLLSVAVYAVGIGAFSDIQTGFTGDLVFVAFGTVRLTLVGFAGLAAAYFTSHHPKAEIQSST
jgi:hypothetical protein